MPQERYDNFYHHNRNYGCRYHEVVYKGLKALLIENEKLRLTVLIDRGTDIIEFLYKPEDIDFMWRSPMEIDACNKTPVTKELESGVFLDIYEGGWQELLPSITAPTNYKGMGLGFHGEVCYLPWDYQVIEDSPYEVKIKFTVRMRRTPFFVKKYITIRSGSSVVEFDETVKNEGDEEFEFMWGHHPAIGKPFLDENCVIDLPEGSTGQMYQLDFSGNSPFEPNTEFDWPNIMDKNNNAVDLSHVMSADKKIAFNTYIKNLKEGWYGLTNLKKGIGFGMKWDVEVFKYMLIWSVYRGFNGFPFYGRTYNIALELYSAIPDSLDEAIKLNRTFSLMPGEEKTTVFSAHVYKSDKRIKGFTEDNEAIV